MFNAYVVLASAFLRGPSSMNKVWIGVCAALLFQGLRISPFCRTGKAANFL